MKYIRVKWNHANPDEPVWLFSEVDADGVELRKLECFRNGFCDFATADTNSGTTRLSTQPLPEMDTMARDPEFQPVVITKEEFEDVWLKRRFFKSN